MTTEPAAAPLPTIAVLGIGLMGWPIAKRLLAAGYPVRAWSRTPANALRLAPLGATVLTDVGQTVGRADIVITLLERGSAVEQVMFEHGAALAMRAGSMMIDMSSIEPEQARDHAKRLATRGLTYLDAPVSGGTLGAEQGTLAIMVGGSATDFEAAGPVFMSLGTATHVGPTGSGQLCKLANQMIVGITIGAVAEALLFCKKNGADIGRVRTAMMGGFASSRVLDVHGQRMVGSDFSARARISVQLKDMRNALQTASSTGVSVPITTLLESLYASAAQHGLADQDQAAIYLELARQQGA